MLRLRPAIVLVLLASLAAPGAMALALELHLFLDHHHAGHSADASWTGTDAGSARSLVDEHHHPRPEAEPDLPAMTSRARQLPQPGPAREAAPSSPHPKASRSGGHVSGPAATGPDPGRVGPGSARWGPGAAPPDTLLSAFCSLLL